MIRALLALFFLVPLQAQVNLTCIPEPTPHKSILQYGCDLENSSGAPAVLHAAHVRRAVLEKVNIPLRPGVAQFVIEREDKRTWQQWVFEGLKWGGLTWSLVNGFIDPEKLSTLERSLPGGISGALMIINKAVMDERVEPRLPLEYLPESSVLAPGEVRAYVLFAMPQVAESFTLTLAAAAVQPAPVLRPLEAPRLTLPVPATEWLAEAHRRFLVAEALTIAMNHYEAAQW